MSRWAPCKRAEFIARLKRFGFQGPYPGGRHEFLVYGSHRLAIPTNAEYSVPQLRLMIREIEVIVGRDISLAEWERR